MEVTNPATPSWYTAKYLNNKITFVSSLNYITTRQFSATDAQ